VGETINLPLTGPRAIAPLDAADPPPEKPVATLAAFRQGIVDALNGLLVLHVTTVIGHVGRIATSGAGAVTTVALDDSAPKVASTVINMAIGDITTTYTPDFISNADLMKLHADAIQTARDVRKETITLLKTALSELEGLLTKKPA
jgi:hypothetical protein